MLSNKFLLIFVFNLSILSAQQTANINDMPYKFSVYPMPTTNEVNIELKYITSFWNNLKSDIRDGLSSASIVVYNILGEVVLSKDIQIGNSHHGGIYTIEEKLFLNEFPSGLYIIAIHKYDQPKLPALYVSKTILVR